MSKGVDPCEPSVEPSPNRIIQRINERLDALEGKAPHQVEYERVMQQQPSRTGIRPQGCNLCGIMIFPTFKYKCNTCVNFILCQGCFLRNQHEKSHSFTVTRETE
jgi:hypothetical protein